MSWLVRVLVALNILGALVSIALLASTWLAQGIIVNHARDRALEKTRAFVEPAIRSFTAGEIAAYQASPDKWLLDLAQADGSRARDFEFPEVINPLARKSLDFLTARLSGAKEHFEQSFANLVRGLRIFAGTNLVAFLLAAGICIRARSPRARHWATAWSAVLASATLASMLVYTDQSWTWNLLFNSHTDWSYPLGVALLSGWQMLKMHRAIEAQAPRG